MFGAKSLRCFRYAGAIALLGMIGAVTPIEAQQHGRITGKVVAAETGDQLEGARVQVVGTTISAVTNVRGQYVLARVPAGEQRIHVSYIGRQPQEVAVVVTDGGTVFADISAPLAVTELGELVVQGSRAMTQAEALSRQRNASNIINVVASDQMGRFPDASAPEAVQRLPGVALARDMGEGRYLQIRGGSAANTQVSFNGIEIPSPEGEIRQIALDAVPVDILEAIEVAKAITPDMDADAIGGAVNLQTRRAPATRLLSIEGAGGLATIRDQASYSGALTYGDRLADGRFGFLFSGSYSRRAFGADNVEASYDLGDPGTGDDVFEEMEIRNYTTTRARTGLTGTFDFLQSQYNSFAVTGIYSRLSDDDQRRAFINVVEDDELVLEHRDRFEFLETYGVTASWERQFRRGGSFDLTAGWTISLEDQPWQHTMSWVQEDVSFDPVIDPDTPKANPTPGAVNGTYFFDEFEDESYITKNRNYTLAANLTMPWGSRGTTGTLKVGAKVRATSKWQDGTVDVAELDDDLILGQGIGESFTVPIRNPVSYAFPNTWASRRQIQTFRRTYGSQLEIERDLEAESNDYDIDETVAAAYVMSEIQLSPGVMILPGVRYERTSVTARGFEWDSEEETITPTTAEKSYGRLFPMVHLRVAAGPRTNIRGAFTTTLARPNFFDLVPYRLRDDEDLALGNPDLEPTIARSLDLLVEHYDSHIGVVSAGVFYKRITDPIFVFRFGNDLGGDTEQPRNGMSGWIRGAEFALQRQLRFLPGMLGGFGVFANYTYTQSEAELPGGRIAAFQGQADHVANLALSYERAGFSAALSWNHHADYIDEYGGDEGDPEERLEDIHVDRHSQWDLSASYRRGPATIFGEFVNLTNEPYRAFIGVRERPVQLEYYERWGRIGIRYNF